MTNLSPQLKSILRYVLSSLVILGAMVLTFYICFVVFRQVYNSYGAKNPVADDTVIGNLVYLMYFLPVISGGLVAGMYFPNGWKIYAWPLPLVWGLVGYVCVRVFKDPPVSMILFCYTLAWILGCYAGGNLIAVIARKK